MSLPNEPVPPTTASLATDEMQTDYIVGQDNIEGRLGPFDFDVHNRVFVVSALGSVIFIALTLLFPERAGNIFQSVVAFSTGTLDWYFMILVDFFILFCLSLVVLPYGKIRLGGPDARPEHSYLSWFAMLFTAGIGIALLFFSVLEPVYHANVSSPLGTPSPFGADGTLNPEAIAEATAMGLAGTFLGTVLGVLLCTFTLVEVNYPLLAPQSRLAVFALGEIPKVPHSDFENAV